MKKVSKNKCDFYKCNKIAIKTAVVYIGGEYKERSYCKKHKYMLEGF